MLETVPGRTERHRRPRERRRGLIILLAFAILIGGLAVGMGAFYAWATGASGPQTKLTITIPQGASESQVADILKKNGVIRSSLVFRLVAKIRRIGQFEAGQYNDLTTNMTISAAIDALRQGPYLASIVVTFPEGWTLSQVADRAADELGVSRSDFLRTARSGNYSLPPYLPKGRSVEGFLFPNTYDFLKGTTSDAVIKRLLDQFKTEAANLPWANAKKLGLTDYQVVVVASMIEREAKFDADRAKIAAVIYNRLKKGMALQIDATVNYALGKSGPITSADKAAPSPYNTYLHKGLPPGPIASPGLASLEAALNPASADYLYYVVIDAAGHHAFASSYDQFLKLKNQYKG